MKNKIVINDKQAEFDTESIIADFTNCKNAAELVQKAFHAYCGMFELKSFSLFSYDKKTSGFIHQHSEGKYKIEKILKCFKSAVLQKQLAQLINSECLFDEGIIKINKDHVGYLIIQLYAGEEVIGLVQLLFNGESSLNDDCKKNIANSFKIFALCFNNFELKKEIQEAGETPGERLTESSEEIMETKSELKTILDFLNVGIFIVERQTGTIADVNLMAQKIIGLSKEEITGKNRSEFFLFAEPLGSTKEIMSTSEGMLIANDGAIHPIIQQSFEVMINKEIFWVDNFIDITDRKDMELELQKAHDDLEERVYARTKELSDANNQLQIQIHERVRAEEDRLKLFWAVHQSPAMIIITNVNGEIEYVNPSFVEITGYPYDLVIGKNPRFLKSGDMPDETYSELWGTILNGSDWKKEFRNKKKNGELYWVSSTISPVKNLDSKITNFLALQEDITEKKKSENELIIAKENAEASAKFKSKLLANMSHEFRTPLISIIGFADLIKDELNDSDHIDLVNEISLSGKRLLNTLSSVLLLSQLETLDDKLQLVEANISERVDELLSPHVMAAEIKGLKIIVEKYDKPIIVKIDHALFDQMVNNLIDNAIKYTNSGSIYIKPYIHGGESRIEIKDTGIGIEKENLEVIFDAFTQVSEGYARDFDGCGLGLTLARKIARTLEGDIFVESIPSVGSGFTISLPLSRNTNLGSSAAFQFRNKE